MVTIHFYGSSCMMRMISGYHVTLCENSTRSHGARRRKRQGYASDGLHRESSQDCDVALSLTFFVTRFRRVMVACASRDSAPKCFRYFTDLRLLSIRRKLCTRKSASKHTDGYAECLLYEYAMNMQIGRCFDVNVSLVCID